MSDATPATDPLARLKAALARAQHSEPQLPEAMVLATVDEGGRPSTRVVLIKEIAVDGLVFYTNYQSRKGRELDANPFASLCVHWKTLGLQVRIEGRCKRVSAEQSDDYFSSRPLGRRLGAMASDQSRPLANREILAQRYAALADEYGPDATPPRPPHWGGYRLLPDRIEFWTHHDNRLHDRELYQLVDGRWPMSRLYP